MTYSVKLSKFLSLVLRHRPDILNLTLDEGGWVAHDELVQRLQTHPGFRWVTLEHVLAVVKGGSKRRLELRDGRLRAVYGHSVEQPIQYQASTPPERLFHGTTTEAAEAILEQGLRSMKRQYVHLSATPELARLVGGRRTPKPVILVIDAAAAAAVGHRFFPVDEDVWLCEPLPAEFIHLDPLQTPL